MYPFLSGVVVDFLGEDTNYFCWALEASSMLMLFENYGLTLSFLLGVFLVLDFSIGPTINYKHWQF